MSEHRQRDGVMTQAATGEGLNRQELAGFMRHMNTQTSNAHATLSAQMHTACFTMASRKSDWTTSSNARPQHPISDHL